ncbi:MAG: ribbon-helix-helix domain-containing protein [Bacteroidota bacterium]
MTTFTSSLPEDLLGKLSEMAGRLAIPKNKIIERALRLYLDQLVRAEYAKSYKKAGDDTDVLLIAEEGMQDYLEQLEP